MYIYKKTHIKYFHELTLWTPDSHLCNSCKVCSHHCSFTLFGGCQWLRFTALFILSHQFCDMISSELESMDFFSRSCICLMKIPPCAQPLCYT